VSSRVIPIHENDLAQHFVNSQRPSLLRSTIDDGLDRQQSWGPRRQIGDQIPTSNLQRFVQVVVSGVMAAAARPTLSRVGDDPLDVMKAIATMFQKSDRAKYVDFPSAVYSTWPYDKVMKDGKTIGISTWIGAEAAKEACRTKYAGTTGVSCAGCRILASSYVNDVGAVPVNRFREDAPDHRFPRCSSLLVASRPTDGTIIRKNTVLAGRVQQR
jgi:hypothetical protein